MPDGKVPGAAEAEDAELPSAALTLSLNATALLRPEIAGGGTMDYGTPVWSSKGRDLRPSDLALASALCGLPSCTPFFEHEETS